MEAIDLAVFSLGQVVAIGIVAVADTTLLGEAVIVVVTVGGSAAVVGLLHQGAATSGVYLKISLSPKPFS